MTTLTCDIEWKRVIAALSAQSKAHGESAAALEAATIMGNDDQIRMHRVLEALFFGLAGSLEAGL
jgi:hypothetical protein